MYNWIETTFNVSGSVTQVIAVILALLVVLLLFSLFVFILRRLMGNNMPQSRSRQPRIAVMDAATVDAKRRLVLIRRDNVEHLLLIGGPSDVVVEQHIVKNAPLASGRAGPQTVQGQHGSPTIKAPMAPGPDIPPRPEETLIQSDPVPQSPQPTPPAPPARASNLADVGKAAPIPAASEKAAPTPKVSTPFPASVEPAAAPTQSAPAGQSSSRAADLLRAASKNGFSRTTAAQSKPAPDVEAATAESTAGTAPPIAPEPAQTSSPSASTAGKAASKFKSLARPFKPRERPAYGNHSISPPASGPAARAKTALLSPLEKAKDTHKTEPDLGIPAKPALTEAADQETTTGLDQNTSPKPDNGKNAGATASDLEMPADLSATQKEEKPSTETDAVKASEAVSAETSPVAKDKEKEKTASEAPAASKSAEASSTLDINLDVESLIFEEGTETEEEQTSVSDTSKDEASKSASPAEEKKPGKTPEVRIGAQSATGNKAPEIKPPQIATSKTTGEPAKASTSLSEKNPIEDEMAKILDELAGQPN